VTLDCDDGAGSGQVCVCTLHGDIGRDGLVTTADASIIKPHFGQIPSEAADNVEFDYDCSGGISTGDFSQVKPKFGSGVLISCP
jgi:hypothetical protein